MLNYIWAALIISSLLFAIGYDVADIQHDRYRNGRPLPVELAFPNGYDAAARRVPVQIHINAGAYERFYDTGQQPAASYDGYLVLSREGVQLRFAAGAELPQPLATIAGVSKSRDDELQGRLTGFAPPADTAAGATAPAGVLFEPVRFVKMNAIAAAALSFAETAAQIALGLIGVLALFLGLLKIGEDAGVIQSLVKVVRPVLRPLFPEVPPDHPALGMIALNPTDDTATNSMVMLLAINTASVQLVPPVLLLAIMGLQINMLIFPIIITTVLSLIIAIVATKLYGRLPGSRASDPNRHLPAAPPPAVADEV